MSMNKELDEVLNQQNYLKNLNQKAASLVEISHTMPSKEELEFYK